MATSSARTLGSIWAERASDVGHLVGLVLLVPVAILAIGTPFALAIRLLLEIVKKLVGR